VGRRRRLSTTLRLAPHRSGHGSRRRCGVVARRPRVLSGGDDREVRLWDVTTGAAVRGFVNGTQEVLAVAFAPSGTRVAAAAGPVRLRLGRDVRQAASPPGQPYRRRRLDRVSPDGGRFSRLSTTVPFGCGTWNRAGAARFEGTPTASTASRSRPTASAFCPPALTAPCDSGTSRPEGTSGDCPTAVYAVAFSSDGKREQSRRGGPRRPAVRLSSAGCALRGTAAVSSPQRLRRRRRRY
jgi:WD40 repeat protein